MLLRRSARILSGKKRLSCLFNSDLLPSSACGCRNALSVFDVQHRQKSTKTISVRELAQGFVEGNQNALPELEPDEVPRYPPMVQGALMNMAKYKDCVLLTRVGKFYELYFEQAEEFAPFLDIKLASKRTSAGAIPMAGFPYTQLDKYLKILVEELNKNVAISEEYPVSASRKASSGNLMFDRIVKRVVTPGTLIDESFLDPLQNNYLLTIHVEQEQPMQVEIDEDPPQMKEAVVGMAWMDVSTGQFYIETTTIDALPTWLARIHPREMLFTAPPELTIGEVWENISTTHGHALTHIVPQESQMTESEWDSMFESELPLETLSLTSAEKPALNLILDYTRSKLDIGGLKLQTPVRPKASENMAIDRSTLRGLEILETSRDGLHQGSLLHALRRTVTKGGARLLRERLMSPSATLAEIEARLDLVSTFLDNLQLRQELIGSLRRTYDVVRLVQKIAFNRGEPDDLVCLARAIQACQEVVTALTNAKGPTSRTGSISEEGLEKLLDRIDLDGPLRLARSISQAIDEDALNQRNRQEEEEELIAIDSSKRVVLAEGNAEDLEGLGLSSKKGKASVSKEPNMPYEDTWIMRRSASSGLRNLHNKLDELKDQKTVLTQDLRGRLNTPGLTLRWSPRLGYFAHVKGGNKSILNHENARVVSSSTSTRSVIMDEWSRLGADMDQIRVHVRDEEQKVLYALRDKVVAQLVRLRRNAAVMDEIDVGCSFATLAQENHLIRPVMNDSLVHKIYGGRHPTVELGLAKSGKQFVRNDCLLGGNERTWLVTGPNMAGKSTFLRQNALITILAQVGSYVPAEYAEIGIVDKIFSRVGAADDLFRDQSTFMVEMLETAYILKHATPRSFVIMDEVGRGTSPSDGSAVAFASLHHLYYTNQCRTLFATHFHDLADLTHDFSKLGRYCTRVDSEDGSFSFIHRLEKGVNRESHALDVARIAGLPEQALAVATETLMSIQTHNAASLNGGDVLPVRAAAAG